MEEALPTFETFEDFAAEKDGDVGGGCARRSHAATM